MRHGLLLVMAWTVICVAGAAEEIPVKSGIVSVGLFKNGLAVVRREVKLPGPGTYLVEDAPEPVHGTWWVRSDAPIETRVTMREMPETVRTGTPIDLQNGLVGKQVTIYFRESQIPPATGKVEAIAQPKDEKNWGRAYQRPDYYRGYWGDPSRADGQPPQSQGRFLILQTENGRILADSSMIAYLKVDAKDAIATTRRAPALLITAGKEATKPTTVTLTYLAKGLAWAPSYRLDIGDPKTLTIEQTAVIKNELADFENAETQLISGFPNMQFAHVTSPLSLRTNWTAFFTQLNQHFAEGHASTRNVASQQVRVADSEPGAGDIDLAATPSGEGVDLHYQSIGLRSIKEGDAISLSIAEAKAPYERIVEWLIPDTRGEDGRFIQDWQRQQDPEKYRDAAWDAVRFKNPFTFPMTTGAAMIVSGPRFNGQQMSYWVNASEETSVRITKALSIRTHHAECEEAGQREIIYKGGDAYRKVTITGELTVNNHRKEDVQLVIRRRFSGDLVSADGKPKKTLREEGAYAVNARNELNWTLPLKSGEEKTMQYRYTVLVKN